MKTITRDKHFFAFAAGLAPIAEIEPGETVIVETHDCFCGQIQTEADSVEKLDWSRINPATGPLFVKGAEPGDTLVVDIREIRLPAKGTMVTIPGEGALGDVITKAQTKIIPICEGKAVFSDKVHLALTPMIGVIGVAPARGEMPNGTPGAHGGNMDCTIIAPGSKVYLPVSVPGALLGMGDLHAVMGDGEIVVCGLETSGEVLFSVSILKAASLPRAASLPLPLVETADRVAAISSAPTVDQAASQAIHALARFLVAATGLPLNEVGMLMSVAGQLRFCQVVDPMKTVRMEFPKALLEDYGFRLDKLA